MKTDQISYSRREIALELMRLSLSAPNAPPTSAELAEAFAIFAKYGNHPAEADYRVIKGGPDQMFVLDDDMKRLYQLRWWYDVPSGRFERWM